MSNNTTLNTQRSTKMLTDLVVENANGCTDHVSRMILKHHHLSLKPSIPPAMTRNVVAVDQYGTVRLISPVEYFQGIRCYQTGILSIENLSWSRTQELCAALSILTGESVTVIDSYTGESITLDPNPSILQREDLMFVGSWAAAQGTSLGGVYRNG